MLQRFTPRLRLSKILHLKSERKIGQHPLETKTIKPVKQRSYIVGKPILLAIHRRIKVPTLCVKQDSYSGVNERVYEKF